MTENHSHNNVDVCPYWLAWTLDNPFRRLLHNPERIMAGMIGPGQTAADLGCGPGYFTLGMAKLVGEGGHVIAVDMQKEMLDMVARSAARKGLSARVELQQCSQERIGLPPAAADFALSFWMIHEVPDQGSFLRQVFSLLKPGGKYLIAEPFLHVSDMDFQKTVELAAAAGFSTEAQPRISFSRAVLLKRP
jgi:ubiquinone/menaquinone biosynthesis C-methylase UbiE